MKLFSDYHNHPLGHDPNRKYTLDLLNQWAESAKEKGLLDVALTDHDRYHEGVDFLVFEEFAEELALREPNMIFRLGIELDNDPESSAKGWDWTEKNYDKLDFILGSIHFLGDWAFDHPNFKSEFDKRDINKLYESYFKEIQRIASSGLIDGLAHLDLIKIFGHRPTADVTDLIDETLQIIKKADVTIELSTAGWSKPVGEIYPSEIIIQKIKDIQIPITIASDAHAPQNLAKDYAKLHDVLKKYDLREVAVFNQHKRTIKKLEE